jgi:2-hydroxychromene-2-carboxylate isomerase
MSAVEDTRHEIKMYSDYKSPYAWLAFDPAFALEERYNVRVRWIPFQLRLKGKGQRSEYSEYKVKYSYMDVRRCAKERGFWIRGPLKIFDTKPALIGGLFAEKQGRLKEYSREAYRLFFLREFAADEPDAVARLLASLNMSEAAYRDYYVGAGQQDYEDCQQEATTDHIFGVPIMLFNGEPFWGQDRLGYLEKRLQEAGLALHNDTGAMNARAPVVGAGAVA